MKCTSMGSRRSFDLPRTPSNNGYFFFNDTATTEIYTLSLHDALPIYHLLPGPKPLGGDPPARGVLAQARHEVCARFHPLVLHAEDVDHVGVANRVDVGRRLDAESPRKERRRSNERATHAPECEGLHERAGDA